MRRAVFTALVTVLLVLASPLTAQEVDWAAATDEAAGYLQEFVRIDTSNPPGDVSGGVNFLRAKLSQAGIATEVFESAPGKLNLLAALPGSGTGKPILLLSHVDVVPANPAQWSVPPFSGALREGAIWGRGTLDDKGHGIMQLMTMLLLKRRAQPLQRGVLLLATADEEVGGELGTQWMVANHWDKLDPALVINEGGSGMRGPFAPGLTAFLVAVAEKQVLWVEVTATGEAGHGSMPYENNADDTLVRALNRVIDTQRPYRVGRVPAEMFRNVGATRRFPTSFVLEHLKSSLLFPLAKGQLTSDREIRAMLHDTVSLTMLTAGYKANVIPSQAAATLDCRLLPETNRDEFLGWLRQRLHDDRISLKILQASESAPISDSDGPFFAAVRDIMTSMYPGSIVAPLLTTGGTDSRFFRAHGVDAYGFLPAVPTPEDMKRLHGVDERLSMENLRAGVEATYRIVERLASVRSGAAEAPARMPVR